MMREYKLAHFYDIDLTITPAAFISSAVLFVVFFFIGKFVYDLRISHAVIGSIAAVLLHWFAELWHDLGHAVAARSTDYPMNKIRLGVIFGLLAATLYPENEPALPPATHIRRALGGPIASLIMSVIALPFVILLYQSGHRTTWLLALWMFVENFFIMTVQVILPLGFNDGSTIQHWMRVSRQQKQKSGV